MRNALEKVALILENGAPFSRSHLLTTYCRLKAKRKIVQMVPSLRPKMETMFGFAVATGDYTTLAYLFEEIFVRKEYLFQGRNAAPCIVDCGSNIGISVLFFKKLFPACRILAFEPHPGTFALLRENVAQNGLQDVVLHNCALAKSCGTAPLYFDPVHPAGLRMSLHRVSPEGQACEVPTVPLSNYLREETDFLKLDIEGAEFEVIQELAASGKLATIREMAIEYHHHLLPGQDRFSALLSLLEQAGFTYQLRCAPEGCAEPGAFQDILVRATRR